MTTVASRDLRNHTADVLRRVAEGDRITITVNGRPVAELAPVRSSRRTSLERGDLLELLRTRQADPGLRDDLAALAESTDDLGPLR
jgi:prevent-host-death family protein